MLQIGTLKLLITEVTVQTQLPSKPDAWDVARKKAIQMRHQLADESTSGSPKSQTGSNQVADVVERFRRFRQKVSLGRVPVRELIEEGRRF